jgi:predicted ATP-dependent protease
MTCNHLPASALRLTINPNVLGFVDTSELVPVRYPWIGQPRAEVATQFGLTMDLPDYNLFVLGDIGSGHIKLLRQAMEDVAAQRPVPPDLCYLYNFDAPEKPHALKMPAGEGFQLRTLMATLCNTLQQEIPLSLQNPRYVVEQEKIQKAHDVREATLYEQLNAYAEAHDFVLRREQDRLVFTYRGAQGRALSEQEMLALSPELRTKINQEEQALHIQINHFFDQRRPMERALSEALTALKRQTVEPLLEHGFKEIGATFKKNLKNVFKLSRYLDQTSEDILKNVELFQAVDLEDPMYSEALDSLLARYRVNLVVDNRELTGAPVIVEDNPLYRQLFGSVEYQSEEDVLITDFSRIRAGSLLKANGGYLLLELRDLLSDAMVWEKLRRFLRNGRLQIEEPGRAYAANAAVSLEPEPVDVSVKLVLIGSADEYYTLQNVWGEFSRYFLAKVDFAEPVLATDQTRRATAELIAYTCLQCKGPHFSAAAVAALLEAAHRAAHDQLRQTANAAFTEELVMESSALARAQNRPLVSPSVKAHV